MRLSIFAYHVSMLMLEEAGAKFELSPCRGVNVKVEIKKGLTDERVWDEVWINGRCCGNRHGGVKELTRLVNEAKPEIEYS